MPHLGEHDDEVFSDNEKNLHDMDSRGWALRY